MPRKHRTPESLALNRENQRRSRARHRELLEDLQRRVRDYERRDGQATLEMQRVARVVNAENVALKGLLAARGVAPDEVEAHLQAARMKSLIESRSQTTPQSAMPPLSVREDLAGLRESRLEPIREMQYDRRLDTPYKMPSPAPSASSSIITSTPSAPSSISVPIPTPLPSFTPVSCGGPSPTTHMAIAPQPMQPKPCSPVIPIPRLGSSMVADRSLPPLQPDMSSPKQQSPRGGSRGINGIPLPMVLEKPLGMVQSRLEQTPAACGSPSSLKPQSRCCPEPQTEQHSTGRPLRTPQQPLRQHQPDQTHCVEAASILARLRGDPDNSAALTALGCAKNRECMIPNTDLIQLMD